ncbi:MAG TPA: PEP/pyruvate-binding domain-containing protein [Anaerolineales bacterium]|nr:PEP/pyruvate-binding domain-containing protein [Anaerolineales bacterium]
MTPFILPLSDLAATLENVGGKGMSLAKLSRAGLPVPGGFHITTEAYRRFVSENGLQPRILAALQDTGSLEPTALEPVAGRIGGFFAEGSLPAELAGEISRAYASLKGATVAVRSSATAEDLPEASFAGQQDTYLNIHGESAVLEAVKRCWASLWTARAIAYRTKQNIPPEDVALAVVVQELVFADAAGVMFTANPVNGRRDEVMVTAAWGLGEAIVSGAVTPDTMTVSKPTGRTVRRETAEKRVMTVRTETGTEERPVPARLQKTAVLKNARVKRLAQLGMEIEKLYAAPMDIEWALAGGKFAILQARPVTALPEPPLDWPLPAPKVMLSRGSLAEFLPDPVSPLFGTLAIPIAGKASLKMMDDFAGLNDPDSYIMTVVNGYVYIGLKMTPGVIWTMAIMSIAASKKMLSTGRERWLAEREKYLALVRNWQARDVAGMTARALLAGVREIFTLTAEYYTVIQAGTIPTALSSEMTFSNLYKLLIRRKGDPAPATFLFGSENQALRAEKSLYDLAMWIKEEPSLLEAFLQEPAVQICTRLPESSGGAAWDEFRSRFAAYLADYGHIIYDLDFAKPIPADDPAPLVQAIKAILDGTAGNPYERQAAAIELRERLAQTVVRRLDPLRRKLFLKQLAWAQASAPLREDSIADIGLGQPQIRKMLGELGGRLARGGVIAAPEDVYWLEARELETLADALDQGGTLVSRTDGIEKRKSDWRTMRKVTPPNVLPRNTALSRFAPREDQHGDTLKGMGASAGKVTGRACVMRGPEDFGRMQPGDVIVAVITTPAWTPLFARASAVVTDIGGPLSHSSIVAREYGIPAVLGTGSATRRIHDGQLISVDGSAGTVSLK